jgi:hypothetical protein
MKKMEKKEKKVNDTVDFIHEEGLWESEDQIEKELEKLSKKTDKMSVLKKQINLYKTVFHLDKNQKHLLKFSEKGKQHTIEKLKENLKNIITIKLQNSLTSALPDPQQLIKKFIFHVWTSREGENVEWNGQIMDFINGIFKVICYNLKMFPLIKLTKLFACLVYFKRIPNNSTYPIHSTPFLIKNVIVGTTE